MIRPTGNTLGWTVCGVHAKDGWIGWAGVDCWWYGLKFCSRRSTSVPWVWFFLSLSLFFFFFSRTSLQIRDTHTQPRNVLDALICECDISMVMNRPSDIVLPPAPIWRLSSQNLLDTEFAATLCILVNQVIPEGFGCASGLLNSFRSNPLGIWMRYLTGSNSGIRGTDYR
jgi:hypothetical protein